MKRTISYTVSQEEDGLRLEQFLRKKRYSEHLLGSLRHMPGSILKNGHPSRMIDFIHFKDELQVIWKETKISGILPVSHPLCILYEDEDLIVLNKPSGMPTHPSGADKGNTLANALAWHYQQQNKSFVFRCANRLDTDTSGVIPVAKNEISAGILGSMSSQKEIHREYLALAHGSFKNSSGTINLPLSRENTRLIRQTVDENSGIRAITHYQVLEEKNGYSLLRVILETGRTHQIRIHLASVGHPLYGDPLYHPLPEGDFGQALHAQRMHFIHPVSGAPLSFEAPLPQYFRQLLSDLDFLSFR